MTPQARLVGFNYVAVEVGDLEEALVFYGRIFEVELRGRGPGMVFADAGDQFLALSEGRAVPSDGHCHVGLVVDYKRAVRVCRDPLHSCREVVFSETEHTRSAPW